MSSNRFHRNSKDWCNYTVDDISHVYLNGDWYYVVAGVTVNKYTACFESYCVRQGSMLYATFYLYFQMRGNKHSDALFLDPLDDWIV